MVQCISPDHAAATMCIAHRKWGACTKKEQANAWNKVPVILHCWVLIWPLFWACSIITCARLSLLVSLFIHWKIVGISSGKVTAWMASTISSKMFKIVCLIQNHLKFMKHLKNVEICMYVFLFLYQASARSQSELLGLQLGQEANGIVKHWDKAARNTRGIYLLASGSPLPKPQFTMPRKVYFPFPLPSSCDWVSV